jgi:hypothetical protein
MSQEETRRLQVVENSEASPEAEKAATPKSEAPGSPSDVFNDLAALRKQSKLTVQRKTVLVNVPVDRPANNVYFRVHPDPDMCLDDTTILRDSSSTGRPYYYVVPSMRVHPKLKERIRRVTIALVYTWPGGGIQLWPVPILGTSNLASWKSARSAFEKAQIEWTQIVWNDTRGDYDVEGAEAINRDPIWPDKAFNEFLKIGFADKIIDNEDHPYVRQLRGVLD